MKYNSAKISKFIVNKREVVKMMLNGVEVWRPEGTTDNYLRVSPNEVQWITDTVGAIFEVESNTDWRIE